MKFKRSLMAAAVCLLLLTAGLFAAPRVTSEDAKHEITAQELKQRLGKGEHLIIVDARHALSGQIINGAVNVPSDKLEEWARTVDKQTVIVTYCTCPHDEAAAAEVQSLRGWGYENAYSLRGGMNAAREAGIAIVAPAEK